ncbi:MAG: zinc-ribbon domain-containing protein, partial [Myxococcota bacterium]
MIVRCANCQTEFSLDDRQVGPDGAPVRCSVCMYVFRVEPPATREASWQIRTVEGLSFTAPDLTTLRQWIREGRLHPEDEVSRTGKNWLRLGDMPEFSEVFRGFGGLPEVFTEMASDRTSAMDELGPPPSFGIETDGTPVQAVTPAPSEAISIPLARDESDSGGVIKTTVASDEPAADDALTQARADVDEYEQTNVGPGTAALAAAMLDRQATSVVPEPGAVVAEIDDDDIEDADDEEARFEQQLQAELSRETPLPSPDDDGEAAADGGATEVGMEAPTAVATAVAPAIVPGAGPEIPPRVGPGPPNEEVDEEELEELEPELLKPRGAGNTAIVRHAEIAEAAEEARRELADNEGVPLPIPRRSSSRPVPAAIEDDDSAPPASMRDAGTAPVKPITRAAIESGGAESSSSIAAGTGRDEERRGIGSGTPSLSA